jgi:hypothetical protein
MQNFQATEELLKDKSEEVRQSRLMGGLQINIGEEENDYKQPSFEINES